MAKPRNPTPVTNPDKGSHYLKKSPSPTGTKSPPGMITNPEDYLQRKAMLTCGQQVVPTGNWYSELNGAEDGDVGDLDRRVSEDIIPVTTSGGGDQILGMLHCTMRYSYDKNALIVTVNKCVNLPPKDSAAKSSDPYVKLQLLPEKQHKVKTRVMRRTLNPVYDEDFTFYGIHYNQLSVSTNSRILLLPKIFAIVKMNDGHFWDQAGYCKITKK